MINFLSFRAICGGGIILYLTFSCMAFYWGDLFYRGLASAVGSLLFFSMCIRHPRKDLLLIFASLIGISAIALINSEWSEFRSIFVLLMIFSCFGVSWAAFELQLTKLAFEYVFIFFLGLTFFLVFFLGYGAKEFNVFLNGSSRNVYSALMLASAVGYVLSVYYRGKSPSLLLLFLFTILSYPLYGRSAIFFSTALLLIVLFSFHRKFLLFFLGGGILILIFSLNFSDIQLSSYLERTNFESGLESERFDILSEYYNRLELKGLFGGQNFTVYPSIASKDGNPHNAFLRLHGYWGGGVFLLFILILLSQLLAVFDFRPMIALFSFIVLARAFFDIVYLFNLFDYLFFPAIFYFFYRSYYLHSDAR